jgi:hypothetical protein
MAHGDGRTAGATLLVIALVLGGASAGRVALAQPSVRVRAATQVDVQAERRANGVEVTGTLRDDLGAPLALRAIELVVDAESGREKRALRTDAEGAFHATLDAAATRFRLRIRFAGDTEYAESESARDIDVTRAEVHLEFAEPRARRADLDHESLAIEVRARSAIGAADLALRILDERGRELAQGRTDTSGALRVEVPTRSLGDPGIGRLAVEAPGDERRAAARAELELLRYRATSVTLSVRSDTDHGEFVFAGALRSADAALAGKAIGLFDGDRHLVTITTAPDGSFRQVATRAALSGPRETTLHVQARFEADAPWLGSSRSAIATLRLPADVPPSPLWLLAPLALCAALLWLLSRRELQQRHEAREREAQPGPGFQPGRRELGEPERTRITGTVRDASDQRALEAATLSFTCGDRQQMLVTDVAGRFDSGELGAGTWKLHVAAPGYAAVASVAVVPHRGEWSDVQVRLASLRSAAVNAYRPAAVRAMPSIALWETWTPRETLDNARRNGAAPDSFVQLTDRVEQAAYAKVAPNADDVAAIESAAVTAISEMPDVSDHADQSQSRNSSALLRARIPHRR